MNPLSWRMLLAALLGAATLAASSAEAGPPVSSSADCQSLEWQSATPVITSPDAEPLAAAGQKIYAARCLVCHGKTGKGDGPGAAPLNPKPESLRERKWQDSVTDLDIKKATVRGGPAVGKSAGMPAHPDLAGKPTLNELVGLIRGFRD